MTEKKELKQKIYPADKNEILDEFNKLKDLGCPKETDLMKKVGNIIIDFFTAIQRMETLGKRGYDFFYVWENRNKFLKVPSIKRMIEYYKKYSPNYPIQKVWWRTYNIYFGSVSQFKPLIAMLVYCKYRPKSILDPTMGWGGRMVGACALDIPKYIGIDLNIDLKKPYEDFVNFLKPHTKTDIKLYFQDALTTDYNKLDYDLVLTSPPYYNIELYKGTNKMTEEDWNEKFYKPLFIKTFNGLKMDGHYCLNVPLKVYEDVCLKVLGKADEQIPLPKSKRTPEETYKEYIYVWKKKNNIVLGGSLSSEEDKLIKKLTPIEKVGDNYIKRDDKFEYAGQKGGKVRSALYLISKEKDLKGLTTAGNRNSPQINIISSIGQKMNLPVVAFTGGGELGDEVKEAQKKGAIIKQVRPSYESVINARAKEYSLKKDYLYIPFGMDSSEVHPITAEQVRNIPNDVKRIVVPVGSASSLIGIIEGIKKYEPDIKVLGVVVGANPIRKLNKYIPDWKKYAKLKILKTPYHKPAENNEFGDLLLDPYYEAKVLPFIKKGDLLWVVGVRETV